MWYNPRIGLYKKTLDEIKAVLEDEGYRKAVESFTSYRLKVFQEEDWETIEKKIGCGQVEELIEEAQDELKLIGHMIEWNPWDIPDGYECEIIENDAPVPKHVPLHRPGPLPEKFYKTLEAVNTGTLQFLDLRRENMQLHLVKNRQSSSSTSIILNPRFLVFLQLFRQSSTIAFW